MTIAAIVAELDPNPATLSNVRPGMRIVREGIVGPVAPVITWTDEATMLFQVNDSEFGLAPRLRWPPPRCTPYR
ncbi:hypothetical protein COO55_38175 [Rhodococcus opacus]|nr:hypothetical protein COO55_38175 [Rhodococcus opacus]